MTVAYGRHQHDIRNRWSVVTGPAALPIHINDLKYQAQAAIDEVGDDATFTQHLASAVDEVEKDTDRAMVWRKIRLTLDCWPDEIELPVNPVLSIVSIQYVDTAGDTQTLSTSRYQTDLYDEPARIRSAYGYDWPTVRSDTIKPITVTFTAGYLANFTVSTSTNVLTVSGYTPVDGDSWRLSASGGDLPAGLESNTDYYVVSSSGQTCSLSLTAGGSAVDITDTGTGGLYFLGELPARLKQAVLVRAAMELTERESYKYADYEQGYRRLVDGGRWR